MLYPGDSPHPPVSGGNFTVPATVLQGAQMTQIGAIMADIVLTCRLRQIENLFTRVPKAVTPP